MPLYRSSPTTRAALASELALSASTAYFMASAEVGNRRYVMWLPPDEPRPLPMNNSAGDSVVKIGHGRIPLGRQLATFALELRTLDNIYHRGIRRNLVSQNIVKPSAN